MTWSYTGDPSVSDVAAVRFEIQDTDVTAQLLQDGEIAWAILQETGVAAGEPTTITGALLFSSAARCMEALAERFTAQADTTFGSLQTTYTTMAKQYAVRAATLRAKAQGMQAPWAGGQSIADKQAYGDDADQVQPKFTGSEFDQAYGGVIERRATGPI
jgi:hypothetical protein